MKLLEIRKDGGVQEIEVSDDVADGVAILEKHFVRWKKAGCPDNEHEFTDAALTELYLAHDEEVAEEALEIHAVRTPDLFAPELYDRRLH